MDVHVAKTVPIAILSLRARVLLKLLKNNKSRVKGGFQARFCERLAGETRACLLDGE